MIPSSTEKTASADAYDFETDYTAFVVGGVLAWSAAIQVFRMHKPMTLY
jgi:hypothetical protein